jgi:dephospho-CoA kinase
VLILGLTGSIGMGKSVTAQLFAQAGMPVHDADAIVHRLYAGEAAMPIEAAFPGTTQGGVVDRGKLAAAVVGNPEAFARLEAIVHPMVRAAGEAFLAQYRQAGARAVLLDIPLLFESKAPREVDAIIVATAPPEVQRARVLARAGMTPERFEAVLAKQMPDAEKRRRAHFLVDSSRGFDSARAQVRAILRAVAVIP